MTQAGLERAVQALAGRSLEWARAAERRELAMESTASAHPLTTALRILVRPAMIANAEKLYGKDFTVDISSDAQSERGECSMWLNFPPARVSGLLIFGIAATGDITWSARVHAKGEQVSSRDGELSRPDAAAEIFSIAKDFVKAFMTAVRMGSSTCVSDRRTNS